MPAYPLIFLHLPKTAGSTLSAVVRKQFPPSATWLLKSDDMTGNARKFRELPEERRHAIRLLRGHQVFGMHTALAPGARYLTVLREPVARITSHFHYLRSNPEHHLHATVATPDMTLTRYAASDLSPELVNGQVRWLCGIADNRALGPEHLEQALSQIDRYFAWVGLTERFDESLMELAWRMRWPRVRYQRINVGQRWLADAVPEAARAVIAERNALDAELYAHIARRFDQRALIVRVPRTLAARALRHISRPPAPTRSR